jgi:hypothetical protein
MRMQLVVPGERVTSLAGKTTIARMSACKIKPGDASWQPSSFSLIIARAAEPRSFTGKTKSALLVPFPCTSRKDI